MMVSLAVAASVATLLLVVAPQNVSSLAFSAPPRFGVRLSAMSGDSYEGFAAEPFFEMQQIPTAATGARLDRVVNCAENDGCDVQEMMEMIDGT